MLLIFAAGPDRFDALEGGTVFYQMWLLLLLYVLYTPFFLSLSLVRKKSKEGEETRQGGWCTTSSICRNRSHVSHWNAKHIWEEFPFFFLFVVGVFHLFQGGREREIGGIARRGLLVSCRITIFIHSESHRFLRIRFVCLVFCFSLIFFLFFFYYFGWSHSLRSPIKGRNKQLMGSHKMEISARPSHLLISCFFFSLLLFHSWWLIRFSSSVIKSLRAYKIGSALISSIPNEVLLSLDPSVGNSNGIFDSWYSVKMLNLVLSWLFYIYW